jgi:hypothetical protein
MSVEAQTHTQIPSIETEAVVTSKAGERLRSGGDFIKGAADRLADRLDARASARAARRAAGSQYVEGGLGDLRDMLDGKNTTNAESGEVDEREESRTKARNVLRSIGNGAMKALRATNELAVGVHSSIEAKAGEVRSALTDRMDQALARKQARLDARAENFAMRNAERLERRRVVQDQREVYALYNENIEATAGREAADKYAKRRERARQEKEQRESRVAREKADREARVAERATEAQARKQARQQKWAARKQVLSLAAAKGKESVGDKVSGVSDALDRFADKVDEKIDTVLDKTAEKAAETRQTVVDTASRVAGAGRRHYESTASAVKTGAGVAVEVVKSGADRVRRGGEWLKTRSDNLRAIGSASISAAVEAGRATKTAIEVNAQLGQ